MNGTAAAPIPRSRMNSRRLLLWAMSLLPQRNKTNAKTSVVARSSLPETSPRFTSGRLGERPATSGRQGGCGHDLDHQLTDIERVGGEGLPQVGDLLAAEGADRLLDQVVEQLLDEGRVRLVAGGQEAGQGADPVEL